VPGLIVVTLYLTSALLAVHAAFRASSRLPSHDPALYVAAAALLSHSAWLAASVRTAAGLALDLADSASLVGWVIGLVGTLGLTRRGFRGASAALLAVAAILSVGTGSISHFREIANPSWPLAAHIGLSALAAGLAAGAALLVVLLAAQDARLRSRRPAGMLAVLPPVESLERAVFLTLGWGFAALSLSLLTGFLFVTNLFEQHLVHKTVLSCIAWLIFAVLLVGRHRFGWRGRKALRLTLGGFAFLLFAYFGSKFILEVMLGRHWG
jgi:ABC-type uncharacterized transport system permease subunit